ncbi:Serine/threonine-protein kinase ULK1 [Trichoderma lentiforme]|uniref:Serine/threonine-protein kinase ULK1 n=1 Tax=Trichoderma lentiforme TaxID=1567552 RepID=A0A9P4X9W6_9HYPO|nr:Serine/threonine-protein kinase ULK1 [Trichoderma lentiforme]
MAAPTSATDNTSITYDHIYNGCINNPDGGDANPEGCYFFLPKNKVESLMQPESVRSTLREHIKEMTPEDVEDLVKYVMAHAKQVFLTLVFSNTVNAMKNLQNRGFKDEDLPVCIKSRKICKINSDAPLECFEDWKWSDIDSFCHKQWIFLAPVFHEKRFIYWFDGKHRLPYSLAEQSGDSAGHFGEVRKLQLHYAHYQQGEYGDILSGGSFDVAVKRLFQNGQQTDVDKFYEKERHTLETMKELNNKHLIKAIATYTKGNDKYFLFPWANGGNLQDMLKSSRGILDKDLVAWVLDQIVGLSEAIKALHDKNIRHGDIKPSNILCSGPDTGNLNESTLIIADVGLAKQHEMYTRYRNKTTTTRHGSITYEPPEVSPKRQLKTLSRKYDIWSLGCVFLELIIWAVYDVHGTKLFHSHLGQNSNSRFWEEAGSGDTEQIHSAIGIWINKLRGDLKGSSALSDVIELIEEKLLIISDKGRADSKAMVKSLETIRGKVSEQDYLFNPQLEELATRKQLSISNGPVIKDVNPSTQRPTSLYNRWRNATENNWAKSLITRLRSSFRPARHVSKPCQFERIFDFGSPSPDSPLRIDDLEPDATDCSLCHLLALCRAKTNPNFGEPMKLFRDDASHVLRSSPVGPPIISIYSDPASAFVPTYAQRGLPYIPESPDTQFKLLNQWIHLCDETHDCMSRKRIAAINKNMPTRVIDVRNDSIRLVETSNNTNDHYVALSHCWGKLTKEERFCTYAHNIDAMKMNIPYKALPKTFQDAVTVTRALDVPYLWIDSLCIIQEDEKDWESEAARMEEVFSSAYCTIAASRGTSSLSGFLGRRKPRAYAKIQTSGGPLYLAEAIDDFHADVEQSELSKRGWVLQERALSRRTIYFTATQIYWECGRGIFCESLAALRNPQSQVLSDSNFPVSSLKYHTEDRIRLIQHINQTYSKLHLTVATDRPKAILGLQSRLARAFESKACYGIYERYFERTLLWEAEEPGDLSLIPYKDSRSIPSWSWMAYTGKIRYMKIPFERVRWTGYPESPFRFSAQEAQCDNRLHAKANQLLLLRDETELLSRVKIDSKDYSFDQNSWKCIVVGKNKFADKKGEIVHYVLLVRSVSSDPQTYERVGAGALLADHISPVTESIVVI